MIDYQALYCSHWLVGHGGEWSGQLADDLPLSYEPNDAHYLTDNWFSKWFILKQFHVFTSDNKDYVLFNRFTNTIL